MEKKKNSFMDLEFGYTHFKGVWSIGAAKGS